MSESSKLVNPLHFDMTRYCIQLVVRLVFQQSTTNRSACSGV